MPEEKQKYSDEVLEETPPKLAKFLAAIGAEPVIRTLMATAGMRDSDIEEGAQLLLAICAQPPSIPAEHDTEEARAQREAVAYLDQWDDPHFARFSATLERHFPLAHAYVFHNLKASKGAQAVAGVATFLSRLDALETGSDVEREATKKDDKEAVKLLGKRGLDKKERDRLHDLVELALKPTTELPSVPETAAERAAQRRAKLVAAKDWLEEWSAAARAVIKKRVYLIRLGLARRKSPKATPEDDGEE